MKVCITHYNFGKVWGGGEKVTASIAEALKEIGFSVEIIAVQSPDTRDDISYSDEPALDFFGKRVKADRIEELRIQRKRRFGLFRNIVTLSSDCDLLLNVSANIIPFVKNPKGSKYSILYFQGPIALDLFHSPYKSKAKNVYYGIFRKIARDVVGNASVLACSKFIGESVKKRLGLNSEVLYPPVDLHKFSYDFAVKKPRTIVVLSRFNKDKNLEFAIEIAKLIDCKMKLIGSITNKDYYDKIKKMSEVCNSKISLLPNAPLSDLIEVLKESQVYLHCNTEEPFGISVIEAMASGCIPIVPTTGGPSEFVPIEWQYSSANECMQKVEQAFNSGEDVHDMFVELSSHFSESKFKERFMGVIQKVSSL